MRVQQGLEGPLDLRSSKSFPPVDRGHVHNLTLPRHNQKHSYEHTWFFPVVERAETLVSSDVFPSQNLSHKQLFFPVSLHIAAPNPQAGFFFPLFCSSNLHFVLWFCRQCSSILFPAPLPSSAAYCTHLTHTVCMADQPETFICRTLQTQSHHQKRNIWNDNNALLSVLSRGPVHHETSLADHCVPRGQPANQPADTEDHSITHHGFV